MQGFDTTTERLRRQRAGLAEIAACALRIESLDELLDEACRIVAAGLGTAFCKILEFRPESGDLLVRAGVGWTAGAVGHARLSAGTESPAGYALQTGQPVICNDLATETRFRTPALLASHGISRAANVLIRGDGESFGVLEVDGRSPGGFTEDDIAFLQAAASLLGIALERARRRQELGVALAGRDLLAREADHRIKNSLQLTASLLTLQRSRLADSEACAALDDAIARVQAVAAIHRVLQDSADLHTVAFGRMLADLCQHVGALGNGVTIGSEVGGGLPLDAERAIPLGLIVSELLTNVMRHAYPDGGPGEVNLRAGLVGEQIEIVVADRGAGFDPVAGDAPSLGTTIVRALARQIGAELEVASQPGRGTTVILRLPRAVPSA
jgi:two-component sensor histidine kinase